MRPIAYVAGPYSTGDTPTNVSVADSVGRALLALGYAPIIPHRLYGGWEQDERFEYEDFMTADLSILRHCHLLVLFGDYLASPGTRREIEFAREYGIPLFGDISCVPPAEAFEQDVQSQAISDLLDRVRVGVERYGRRVYTWTGRDALQDAYEEALDMVIYLRQHLTESTT